MLIIPSAPNNLNQLLESLVEYINFLYKFNVGCCWWHKSHELWYFKLKKHQYRSYFQFPSQHINLLLFCIIILFRVKKVPVRKSQIRGCLFLKPWKDGAAMGGDGGRSILTCPPFCAAACVAKSKHGVGFFFFCCRCCVQKGTARTFLMCLRISSSFFAYQ